eukprot:11188898-Alexandrium_andersonii.AAC.1
MHSSLGRGLAVPRVAPSSCPPGWRLGAWSGRRSVRAVSLRRRVYGAVARPGLPCCHHRGRSRHCRPWGKC